MKRTKKTQSSKRTKRLFFVFLSLFCCLFGSQVIIPLSLFVLAFLLHFFVVLVPCVVLFLIVFCLLFFIFVAFFWCFMLLFLLSFLFMFCYPSFCPPLFLFFFDAFSGILFSRLCPPFLRFSYFTLSLIKSWPSHQNYTKVAWNTYRELTFFFKTNFKKRELLENPKLRSDY